MGVTFARMGDTPESVTQSLLGYHDANFARRLWQANAYNQCRVAAPDGEFAHARAIWVPDNNPFLSPDAPQMIMTYFNKQPRQQLERLAAAQSYGLSPQLLLGAHEMLCRLNHSYFTMAAADTDDATERGHYLDQAAAFALTASHTGIDVRKHGADKVRDKIKALNKAMLDERSVRRSKSSIKYVDKALLEKARNNRIMAMQDFQKVNQTFLSDKQSTYLLKQPADFWDNTLGRRHWNFSSIFDSADLASVAEVMEHVANGLIVLDIGLAAHDVYDKWKEGKDWEYQVMQDAADVGVGLGIGLATAAVFVAFFGGGWVVCVAAGVVAGTGSWSFDHYTNPLARKQFEPFINRLRHGNIKL